MSRCRSCGAPVLWIRTAAGRRMPLDADSWWIAPDTEGGELGLNAEGEAVRGHSLPGEAPGAVLVRTSHFATCPNAAAHRRPKERS